MWNPKPYRRWRKARNPCEATNGSLFKHVEPYSFTRNLANLKNDKQWMELFELACKEKNQDQLAAYFDDLRLLDEQVRLAACWQWQTARHSSANFEPADFQTLAPENDFQERTHQRSANTDAGVNRGRCRQLKKNIGRYLFKSDQFSQMIHGYTVRHKAVLYEPNEGQTKQQVSNLLSTS